MTQGVCQKNSVSGNKLMLKFKTECRLANIDCHCQSPLKGTRPGTWLNWITWFWGNIKNECLWLIISIPIMCSITSVNLIWILRFEQHAQKILHISEGQTEMAGYAVLSNPDSQIVQRLHLMRWAHFCSDYIVIRAGPSSQPLCVSVHGKLNLGAT